jgi:hypothetical protein
MRDSQCSVRSIITLVVSGCIAFSAFGCAGVREDAAPVSDTAGGRGGGGAFTVAMVPDTQNYVDYTHQKAEGFAIDAAELFIQQMEWIAEHGRSNGGDIDFVASVGDTWQHPTLWMDDEHKALGIGRVDNPLFGGHFDPSAKVVPVEVAKAIEGYQLIADARIPFGVPPGNHDYDAMYNVDSYPPNLEKKPHELTFDVADIGVLHVGGLDSFRSAFGADSAFFAGKPWYVGSFEGGTSSAQIFEAGGYRFLHLAMEMQPGDDVIAWAEKIMSEHPGLPTIVSTHDYLSPTAERLTGGFLDFTLVDAENHNSTEQMFQKLIFPNDQIFLVLCGHYHGQAFRVDSNATGTQVYQVLADYQDRGQVGLDAGQPPGGMMGGPTGLGDGWLRLLRFDTASNPPTVQMQTYSTYYGKYSSELPEYSKWYREHEQSKMSDQEFLAAEEYEIVLEDFRERFGAPKP